MQKNKELFSVGDPVEVRYDAPYLEGAWFSANIVEARGQEKFTVQFWDLFEEDDVVQPHREEIDTQHIRHPPGPGVLPKELDLTDTVDVFYNDAWRVASIIKLPDKSKSKSKSKPKLEHRYEVNLWSTHQPLEVEHSDLRPHHH